MAYNKSYNTHYPGRYNTPGQFVPGGKLLLDALTRYCKQPQQSEQDHETPPQLPQQQQQQQQGQQQNLQMQMTQTTDVEMNPDLESTNSFMNQDDSNSRPHWMKSKLAGVKKISNKERRRRQNETLRRLLTPKNALMVLNEMLPKEQVTNQFRVEPTADGKLYKAHTPNFCAALTLAGTSYKGYGENKLLAKNAAAEQAIRDLIISKMTKALATETTGGGGVGGEGGEEAGESEETLPMLQLASFALHKLFAEWECEGHRVPHLKSPSTTSAEGEAVAEAAGAGDEGAGAAVGAVGTVTRPRPVKKPKEVPPNASAIHPCMLLSYLRPHKEYSELAVEGTSPQNIAFTMGVEIDGVTYVGKASNKKEARKAAARAACEALFHVTFDNQPSATVPPRNSN